MIVFITHGKVTNLLLSVSIKVGADPSFEAVR